MTNWHLGVGSFNVPSVDFFFVMDAVVLHAQDEVFLIFVCFPSY